MNWQDIREAGLRFLGLWRRRRNEQELSDELEFHLAMKMKAGQTSTQARRQFGGVEKWKEASRDVKRPRLLEEFARDLALAVRMLRQSPVFTSVALVTLTLAIGANTAIFSLMNELMLKSVPVPNAGRLVRLRIQPGELGYAFSYPLFDSIEQGSRGTLQLFAFSDRVFQLRHADAVENLAAQFVSGQYFSALGLKPQLGRWIQPHDDRPGAPDGMVAVVSASFWRSHLGSDPHAAGRSAIVLNHQTLAVIGVMPEGFRGMSRDRAPDIFVPLQLEPALDVPFSLIAIGYRAWWLSVGARLQDGVSLARAGSFLQSNAPRFFASVPLAAYFRSNEHQRNELRLLAEPGSNGFSNLRLRYRKPLFVLMGLVATVLLIACLNLATLLTARASARARELATRAALGAGRGRLVRQLMTESLLLATLGALLGLAVAPLLVRFISAMLTARRGPQSSALFVSPDFTVFAFVALLAVLATVTAGTLPALRGTGFQLQAAIQSGSASIRGADRRRWWPRFFLVLQVALSLVLVTGAALLGISLFNLRQSPLGFNPQGLIYLLPDSSPNLTGDRLFSRYRQILDGIRHLPQVQVVSMSAAIPIRGMYIRENLQAVGGVKHSFVQNAIGPDYFSAMGTPLIRGRDFRWTDTASSGRKLILNLSAAKVLFPAGPAVGQNILLEDGKTQAEVIGIVADSKYNSLRDPAPPIVYVAALQHLIKGAGLSILMRVQGSPAAVVAPAAQIVRHLIPDIPPPPAMSMEETIADSLAIERAMTTLALFFGGLSLVITAIGLYGTLAYATQRRTGEIGIRLALGAQPRNVIFMVCAENTLVALLGCTAGIAASLFTAKAIASYLYGLSARDPRIFAGAAFLLLLIATAASLVPAIRATRIDPLTAIRHD